MEAPRPHRSNIVICIWENGRISYHGSWADLAGAARWGHDQLDHLEGVVTWRARTINVGWSEGTDGLASLIAYQARAIDDLPELEISTD